MRLFTKVPSGKILPILFIAITILFNSCSDDETEVFDVQITSTSLGNVLTNGEGRTLYFFAKDVGGTSNCNGGCADAWPAFAPAQSNLGDGLATTDFATINRGDGGTQLTYKGWPLYYFSGDAAAGDLNGENSGGRWFVAKPDYSIMIGEQSVGGTDMKYLTDENGNSLYYFSNDTANTSNCNGNCETTWPKLNSSSLVLPSIFTVSQFGSTSGSQSHVSFQTKPLYFFANDTQRGNINGNGVGQVWFLQPSN
jgi:predicted lipoprotein with Yx(FWY)xxD motif